MQGSPQSSRPGRPCLKAPEVYPFSQNTSWRVELGERIVNAVSSDITEEECEGYTLFGDQTWCMKAMRHAGGFGFSFGIEERDMWSETMSNSYRVPTKLFDCFIPPERSPPIAGSAQNATGSCVGSSAPICYEAPYYPHRVCLGAKGGMLEGRLYTTLHAELAGRAPLSMYVKIDVEGSEWTILEQLLASPEDLAKVRTLDMEVHFGFNAASERKAMEGLDEHGKLLREVRIMEELGKRMQVTGTTLEVYREGWWPHMDCPKNNCREPVVHVAGGFSVVQFAVSYVNRAYLPGRPLPELRAGQGLSGLPAATVPAIPAAPQETSAPAASEAPAAGKSGEAAARSGSATKYGFYMHVFSDPAAVIFQVRKIKEHFPGSPIYVMSDGGMDFSELCRVEGCTFQLCPPANDRWHPWPFFRRFYDAAEALGTEYVIMLEPDNTIHGPIKHPPTADAGGIYVSDRSFGMVDYVERQAQERVPGYRWTHRSMSAGLAGGAYFRRAAVLDAFSDENMMRLDWNYLAEKGTKEIYSSDFAMQFALAARGYRIEPWEETAQMDKHKDIPLTGPADSAFRHYCSCYPGGKPTYNLRMNPQDDRLVRQGPSRYSSLNSVCQLCYSLERYVENWGTAKCTNRISFNYSALLMSRYHPELQEGKCESPWLCNPRDPRFRSR